MSREADNVAEVLLAFQKRCSDEGKLIEAGWIGLRIAIMPADAPQIQIDEMRKAFFAGAQHLFHSMMGILDPGEEPTEQDIDRMSKIDAELETFLAQFKLQHGIALDG